MTRSDFVTIVASSKDPASQNIAQNLLADPAFRESEPAGLYVHQYAKVRLRIVEKLPIYLDPADIEPVGSSIIFASKHVSSTNRAAMTVHATGNLVKNAEFGGRPEEASFVDPEHIQRVLRKLADAIDRAGIEMEVTMEATHHGPTSFPVPVCFVEIGSGPKEWTDPRLGRIAADAIMEAATNSFRSGKRAVGFGGPHYPAKFTRLCLEGAYQVGHVVPRHAFESGISDTLIRDTILKTFPDCQTVLVDWKGLRGNDRKRLLSTVERLGRHVEKC